MKKRMKMLFCLMLAVILCMGMASPASAASAKYTAAVKKYNSFLKKNKGYYQIVDVDGNGIPELIYQNYAYGMVYTYNSKTKKKVLLAKIEIGRCSGASVMYSTKKKVVLLPTLTTNSFEWTIYKIKGTKATKVLKAYNYYPLGQKNVYKINGKSVTKSTFNKKVNAYKKTAKYIQKSNW